MSRDREELDAVVARERPLPSWMADELDRRDLHDAGTEQDGDPVKACFAKHIRPSGAAVATC